MLRLVSAQVLHRRGRSLAVVAAIVVAAMSFSLLTSAVETSRLQVQGTVEANFRTAYDILVRPSGSITQLERDQRLVQENYLSGVYGGISMQQYREIGAMPGVEVAAPVAMVGYILPFLVLDTKLSDFVTGEQQQLFRITHTWVSDRGLSNIPTADRYEYVTQQPFRYTAQGQSQIDPQTGRRIVVCGDSSTTGFAGQLQTPKGPFDSDNTVSLACNSLTSRVPGPQIDIDPPGVVNTELYYPFPILLAAIDPEQEAKLVGVDDALVSGRYLTSADQPSKAPALPYRRVPVLMADEPLTDQSVKIQVQRLDTGAAERLPGRLAAKDSPNWVASLDGPTVRTVTLDDSDIYPRLLRAYARPAYLAKTQFWTASDVQYENTPSGHLTPVPRHNGPMTWSEPLLANVNGGYLAPAEAADTGFRNLRVHIGSNCGCIEGPPILHQVGVFDPANIAGFSKLSHVPLTTYYPPSAAPGDPRTDRLLHGRALAPNGNLAGYLQQPPMMLTTLRSLPAFGVPGAFTDNRKVARTPISVIRVRVAGVTGADDLSRERVRLVAERIARETGLDVDVTIGSSPTPQLIDLPPGGFGRPALTLKEGWVQKGAAVKLLSAIDTKSLALFVLVLAVCLLFLLNATIAAVRTRRTELGVLACLGWPARRIFALLEVELLATGLLAGLFGTGVAGALSIAFELHTTWWQLALITPVATLLAALAGVGPAWQACHARPIEAITPAIRAPRRAGKVRSVTGLAVIGLARLPGRTLLGAMSLFIGVAALAVLIAIQTAFQGGVAGTLLGDVVAVQVRGVDYLAAGLTIGLGAFAVADVAYLNIAERTGEIGTFRASGWTEGHVRRLFGTEAVITAAVGATLGAAVGVTAVAILFPIAWQTTILAAVAATGAGLLAAVAALTIPLSRLSQLAPANAIATE